MFELRCYYQCDDLEQLKNQDTIVEELAGRHCDWSGMGVSCIDNGNRDMGWLVQDWHEAQEMKNRITLLSHVRVTLREK